MPESQIKVLLVEDNDDHTEILRRLIRKSPRFSLERRRTLGEGIKFFEDNGCDAVLLDLTLPDSKTFETFHRFSQSVPSVPIVVLTSIDDTEFAGKLLKEGAQDYLTKSQLSAETIHRSIRYSIERTRLQKQLHNYSRELEKKNVHLEKLVEVRTQKLSKSEQKYRSLINNSPLSMLILNRDGEISFVNPEFLMMFGYEEGKVPKNFESLFPGGNHDDIKEIKSGMQEGMTRTYKKKLDLVTESGEKVWSQVIISPIATAAESDNQYLMVVDDNSDVRKQEQIEKEKKIAEEANRAKTDFLTNVSHEIRTPLSAITGFVDLIIKNNQDNSQVEMLNSLKRNSQHLLLLVNDLLDLSKIESGQLDTNITQFSLSEELQSIVQMVKPLVLNLPIEVEVDFKGLIPKTIQSDLQKFRQIFINLVNNAIKYTEKGAIKITIKVCVDDSTGEGKLKARIKDPGYGMSAKQQKQLFTPFSRGQSKIVMQKEGLGVGLALSRRLAQSLGGDINLISSAPGKGSTFEIVLPLGSLNEVAFYRPEVLLSKQKIEQLEKRDQAVTSLAGKKILVVDDVEDIQFLVRTILENAGANVYTLSNGEVAVAQLKAENYDLVLMDIQMPIMGGFEAIQEIRGNGYKGKVLALTAHAFKSEREKCLKVGFDGFVSKPFSESQLIASVKSYLAPEPEAVTPSVKSLSEEQERKKKMSESYRRALEIFYKNLNQTIQELKESVEKGEWVEVKKSAHKLKGSSGCYGYSEMSQIMADVEVIAKESDSPDKGEINNLLEKLNVERTKVKFDLEARG